MTAASLKLITREEKQRLEIQESIVKELESLLTGAKSGEFAAFVGVVIKHDGRFKTCIPKGEDAPKLIGYLETLKYDLIQGMRTVEEDANGSA